MDALLFHPKVVHLPMALAVLMPLLGGGLLLAWWRQWLPPRSWAVVFALQAVLFGSGLVALQTGEVEEERVERIVPEQAMEAHEEAAEVFVWASGGVLAIMGLALWANQRKAALPIAAAATLGALVVLALGYRVGQAGGELVYRHQAARAYLGAGEPAAPNDAPREHHESDDDDD